MKLASLLDVARKLEEQEVSRLGECDGWKVQGDAVALYERIFECFEVADGKFLEVWHHRERHEFSSDLQKIRIHRGDLIDCANEYIEQSWLRSKEMDWCLVNMMIYAELQAFLSLLLGDKKTRWMLPEDLLDKPEKITTSIVVQCVFWLAVLVLSFALFYPSGPILLFVAYVINAYVKTKRKNRVMKLLEVMLATYASAPSVTQSWLSLWNDLQSSKQAGVVWDAPVFSIAESKLN